MPGVYLSYPFCRQKCTFCNFASGVQPAALADSYHHALLHQLRTADWLWTPDTLYLGGGTPGSAPIDQLTQWLAEIPGDWNEATIEAAPGDIAPDHARAWRTLGLNRVSLGVQSFVDAELRQTGRRHNAATVAQDVATLRHAGFDHLNLDLIAGLPHQTLATWNQSLDAIERLTPDHVSVYLFEIDEDSRLGQEVLLNGQRYGAPLLPSDSLTVDLYETAVDRLAAMGLPRYEISNFARPGAESRHNLKYWQRAPYLGFGSDAHSFDGRFRYATAESLQDFVDRANNGSSLMVERTLADPGSERFYLGLRLSEGIIISAQDRQRYHAVIQKHVASGLLTLDRDRLCLTRRGVLLSNEVFQDFLPEPVAL